jgi:aerobic carbon-monoxide dehydrogenase medium subunit
MYTFDYRRPHSVDEADLALKGLPGAKLLAGGQTLIPTMKQRLNRPPTLVDLGAIAGLRGIAKGACERCDIGRCEGSYRWACGAGRRYR